MIGRITVIMAAIGAVIAAAVISMGDGSDEGGSRAGGASPKGALTVSFVYSPEKEPLLEPLIARFNEQREEVGGKPVFVRAEVVSSGEAESKIARGRMKPVLWSPASSFWGRLLNFEADRPLVADDNPSIVRTPLVIAMWKRLADAYGHPRRKLGFAQLRRLATEGWAAVGRPEFGTFKFVHTNPDFSTSGLSAVAAQYYAAVGKREGLTVRDVNRAGVRAQVRELERSIVHYGDTTLFISDEMRRGGLGYASAVAMEEITLIDFNRRARGERLVALYPQEGTFYSDNPLITLRGPWVTGPLKQAAAAFARFLAAEVTPQVAGRNGFRPADADARPAGLVTAANGVDSSQPKRVLKLPEPRVLARIKAAWRADRKPANVMVVLDNSGSMGEEDKLTFALDGLRSFLREAAPQDRIGLTKFSTKVDELVPIGPMRANRGRLLSALETIFPEGDTRVRDATVEGIEAVERRLDKDAINAVVVLTDGQDTASSRSAEQVVRELERQGDKETGQIRVFTIAYGAEPNAQELARYAEATGGKAFTADTSDIDAVYRSISSFF